MLVQPVTERLAGPQETRDVPAFVTEEYMPPANELKYRIDFNYHPDSDIGFEKDSEVFWKKFGKRANAHLEDFIDKRRAMADAVSQIVAPGDTPDVKLHKIYERAQRIRNLSYERQNRRRKRTGRSSSRARTPRMFGSAAMATVTRSPGCSWRWYARQAFRPIRSSYRLAIRIFSTRA